MDHGSDKKRLFVTDNYYGRHKLDCSLDVITDGKSKLISTIRFRNVNSTDKPLMKELIERIDQEPQGTWYLVQVTDIIMGMRVPHEKCGYIIFKDKKVVTFYTNDLSKTPTKNIKAVLTNVLNVFGF